jgi:hypothetical protein
MDLSKLKEHIDKKMKRGYVSGKTLLDRMRVITENSRLTSAYLDGRYAPFYYHLGTQIEPKTMMEIGFNLGLLSGCFLKSCKTVEDFLAFQKQEEDVYYSPRLGRANIIDNYKGNIHIHIGDMMDEVFSQKMSPNKWDLIILNEETEYDQHRTILDLVWPHVSSDGCLVMDYVESHDGAKRAWDDFTSSVNCDSVVFNTRYGTGMVLNER